MTKKFLAAALAAVMAFSFAACSAKTTSSSSEETTVSLWDTATYTEDTEIGEGANTIALTVTAEEKSVVITIHTDEESFGKALRETEIGQGSESEYGLYVTTVNGMTADYDATGAYWSFYQGEEYSRVGVDEAMLEADVVNEYTLAYEVWEG